MNYHYKTIISPLGTLTVVTTDLGLVSLLWENEIAKIKTNGFSKTNDHPLLIKAESQLQEYFRRERTSFDLPLNPIGTEFQKRAWKELSKIPYGQTITYGEQARRLGQPNSARAVGAANGKNPLGIIVPCHRVIGASGALTGFAGGMEAKRHLLTLEGFAIKD